MITNFRDLDEWRRSMDLSVAIYKITEGFPNKENFGLTSQIRRSSTSIPSNIAEGHSRSTKDFARFLMFARGSLAELETQLEIAQRVGYLSNEDIATLSEQLVIIGKQLNALIKRLKRK